LLELIHFLSVITPPPPPPQKKKKKKIIKGDAISIGGKKKIARGI